MALYEYQCKKCGRKTEVIQRFSDPAPEACPHCGGTLTKLLSSPAFQFKGSGFYSTDYGKAGRKAEDSSREKEGDSSKEKVEDSSKGKAEGGGTPGESGAETKGGSEGDSSKGKDSKDSSKEKSPDTAKSAGSGDSSTAPPSPSKKGAKRK